MTALHRALASLAFVFALGAAAPLSSQGDTHDLGKLTKSLAKVIRAKADQDRAGVRILDELGHLYPRLPRPRQKIAIRAIAAAFRARRKPDETTLLVAAGELLSRLGEPGAAALARGVSAKRWKNKPEWAKFRARLALLLGRPASTDHVETLLALALRDNSGLVRAAAGAGLASYSKHPQAIRRPIVSKLGKHLSATWASWKSRTDPSDPMIAEFQKRYETIATPWFRTLKALTGKTFKSAPEWTRWWNDKKNAKW